MKLERFLVMGTKEIDSARAIAAKNRYSVYVVWSKRTQFYSEHRVLR